MILSMIGFLTPLADEGISYAYGFVFAATNFAAALLIWFFLYESRTLSLENVDMMYGQEGLKPWTSHKWVPPGYINRHERDETHFRNLSVSNPSGAPNGEKKSNNDDSDELFSENRHESV